MSSALAWVVATFITLPMFFFYLTYVICVKITKNKKSSLKFAVDCSTCFFIIAVYFIAYEIWSQSLLWLIIIFIILTAMVFTVIHWKLTEDIQLGKLLKGIWRFNFLLFAVVYLFLSVYGLFVRVSALT